MSTEIENWSPKQVHEALSRKEIVLIDLRTPQEYLFEHIEGSLLTPMASVATASLPSQETKRIVFHCGSGVRSEKVGKQLLSSGFTKLAHLEGGLAAWKKAGLPYIATDMSTGAPTRIEGKSV